MFVLANFCNFLGPLLLGIVLDNYGPRMCSALSSILIALGFSLFAISDVVSFPMFIPGMCLIAFGGPGVQNSIIHLSNLFPSLKASATAIITGSFQLSFSVFFILDQLWVFDHWNYRQLFFLYAGVCVLNTFLSLFFWPDQPYHFVEQLHEIVEESNEVRFLFIISVCASAYTIPVKILNSQYSFIFSTGSGSI